MIWHLQVAEMQQKRGSHASTVAFDQVFALGGWDANAFLVRMNVGMHAQHTCICCTYVNSWVCDCVNELYELWASAVQAVDTTLYRACKQAAYKCVHSYPFVASFMSCVCTWAQDVSVLHCRIQLKFMM